MTTYEKSAQIIAETIENNRAREPREIAALALDAMRKKRIVPHTLRASDEMFTRFHAHCKHLGNETGRGYEYYYNLAIRGAMATDDWPIKIIPRRIRLDTGQIVDVDVPMPESTTKATNGQLLAAYAVIQDEAKRAGVALPEGEG